MVLESADTANIPCICPASCIPPHFCWNSAGVNVHCCSWTEGVLTSTNDYRILSANLQLWRTYCGYRLLHSPRRRFLKCFRGGFRRNVGRGASLIEGGHRWFTDEQASGFPVNHGEGVQLRIHLILTDQMVIIVLKDVHEECCPHLPRTCPPEYAQMRSQHASLHAHHVLAVGSTAARGHAHPEHVRFIQGLSIRPDCWCRR